MGYIHVEKPHSMPIEEVKRRITEAFGDDIDEFDVTAEWKGNVCEIRGEGANGAFRVEPDKVVFELTTSILARAAGIDTGRIEQEVRSRLDEILS